MDTLNRLKRYLKPIMNQRGEVTTSWIDTLPEETRTAIPEDFRKDPNVTKYKDLPEFLKGHRNAVEAIGKKGVIVPTEKATPEEWNKFYNELGRPEKPDGYKFNVQADKLHPSIKLTPENTKRLAEAFHQHGIPQAQADKLVNWYLSDISAVLAAQDEASATAVKQGQEALAKEWGDKMDANLAQTKLFVERVGGKEAVDAFGDLGSNPAVLKMLHKLSSAIGEDTINKIITGHGTTSSSEQEAILKQINEIKANKAHAYWNENDPKHDEAVREMKALYEKAYPNQ